jgi:hypothetical protein
MVRINAISHKVAYVSFLGKVLEIGLHPHHPHPLQYASCIQPFNKKHWTGLHMVRTHYAHARKKKTTPSSRVLELTHRCSLLPAASRQQCARKCAVCMRARKCVPVRRLAMQMGLTCMARTFVLLVGRRCGA